MQNNVIEKQYISTAREHKNKRANQTMQKRTTTFKLSCVICISNLYSCPMKPHHLQKWLYLFNDITFFCNCVLLYCSNSGSYWYVFKTEWSLLTRAGRIQQNNRQNRKPSNVSEFSKALFSHFSLYKLQRISKMLARNSNLTLKATITSRCDVTSTIFD